MEGAEIPRERGWGRPVLAFLALLFLPAAPPFALLLPVDQALLPLAPTIAVAAIVGWRSGGRISLAVLWTAIAVWVLWAPNPSAFGMLSRGWAVLVAACFGAALLWRGEASFLPRALVAIAAAMLVGFWVALGAGGVDALAAMLRESLAARVELLEAAWREFTLQPQWESLARDNPAAERLAEQVQQQFTALPEAGLRVAPAMLALQTLAVLALGWGLYHRVGRVRLGPPLAALKDLRFHDAFIWGLIAGLLALVVPMPTWLATLCINALVFFGALYALRGLGVLLWFLAPGRWMLVVWSIVLVMFWSVIGAIALAIGVGDTWLDWRNRPRPKSQRSE